MLPDAPISFFRLEKFLGLELESSLRSLPLEIPPPL